MAKEPEFRFHIVQSSGLLWGHRMLGGKVCGVGRAWGGGQFGVEGLSF